MAPAVRGFVHAAARPHQKAKLKPENNRSKTGKSAFKYYFRPAGIFGLNFLCQPRI